MLPLLLASCATLTGQTARSSEQPAQDLVYTSEDGGSRDAELTALMTRMDQLEQDMAEIRIEMSRILPAIERLSARSQGTESNRAADLRTMPANTMDTGTAPPEVENRFAVHLASYRDRETAIEGWTELRGRFGPVLNSLEPRVSEVSIENRGTFYRLKAGPFPDWAGANEVCDYLRGESWSCAVMDFSGEATE